MVFVGYFMSLICMKFIDVLFSPHVVGGFLVGVHCMR